MNPFIEAFTQSDWMGKLIFLSLIGASILCWALLIQKTLITRKARIDCLAFYDQFRSRKQSPLQIELPSTDLTPLSEIYQVLKKQTLEILNKNRRFGQREGETAGSSTLSAADIDFIETHTVNAISQQTQKLEQNLFLLSTIVTLAPFLGLLGTVWGILVTFSQLQTQAAGSTHQMVLGGLSLALTTTVLGLIIAIPALIGFNYLKSQVKDINGTMEAFSNELLASVELQYRQVDIR